MLTILFVVVLMLLGVMPMWPDSRAPYYPSGRLGFVFLALVNLKWSGRL